MSSQDKMEKQNQNKLSISSKSKSVPSLLLLSQNEKEISKNSIGSPPNPYDRLKSIEEVINSKYDELIKIKNKLAKIKIKEKLIEKEKFESIEESLPLIKKQEIIEDNKIKNKLNIQNISLNNKLKFLTEKVNKIESELINGSRPGFIESMKSKLKEVLNKKEMIILKINENNNAENDKNYLKNILEEEKDKKIKDEKIKEQKYKEMRKNEIQTVQKRKNLHVNFEKEMLSKKWINNLTSKKNYISWEEKEKQRKKNEEELISLSNYQRSLICKPFSSGELQEFSKKVKKEEIKNKNNSIRKKKMFEILWKERKDMLPKHKSKFLIFNIQNDKKIKEDLILKKEKIKGNMNERLHFSSEVCKKFRPKLIDEKIRKERIKKILELDGINKQKEIKELNNRLKLKLIRIVNTQPKNFKKNNIFEKSKSVLEQQILKLQNYKNLELSIINSNNDTKNIFTPKNIKPKSINKSINNPRNYFFEELHREKSYQQFLKDIQSKIRILNQFIE